MEHLERLPADNSDGDSCDGDSCEDDNDIKPASTQYAG